MNLTDNNEPVRIPPITKEEANKMMHMANKDIDDAERVVKGENIHIVRPCPSKGFRNFCKQYKEIKESKKENL